MTDPHRPLADHVPPFQARRGGIAAADLGAAAAHYVAAAPLGVDDVAALVASGGWCVAPGALYDIGPRPLWEYPDRPFGYAYSDERDGLDFDRLVAPRLTAALGRLDVVRRRAGDALDVLRGRRVAVHPQEIDEC